MVISSTTAFWFKVNYMFRKIIYLKYNPQQVAENILNRKFEANKSNQKWLTDV